MTAPRSGFSMAAAWLNSSEEDEYRTFEGRWFLKLSSIGQTVVNSCQNYDHSRGKGPPTCRTRFHQAQRSCCVSWQMNIAEYINISMQNMLKFQFWLQTTTWSAKLQTNQPRYPLRSTGFAKKLPLTIVIIWSNPWRFWRFFCKHLLCHSYLWTPGLSQY